MHNAIRGCLGVDLATEQKLGDSMAEMYKGSCFCGAVEVQVTGPSVIEGYCHCKDCRAWSATPITAYALWPADQTEFTKGQDKVVTYSKTGSAHRQHCSDCGSLLATSMPGAGLMDVYPLRLEGRAFEPKGHVNYASRVMDVKDGLPKFTDLPAEAGGSGTMIEE